MIQATHAPIPGPAAYSDEWYAARKRLIGASEAAAACGVSQWEQPLQLYLRKRGEIGEIEENDAMRLGTLLEPVVIAEYERRVREKVKTGFPLYFHPQHHFIAATIDGRREDDGRLVEAKTASGYMADAYGKEGTDKVAPEYIWQTHQQMFVMGEVVVDVPVLFDGRTLKVFTVHRCEALIDYLVEQEVELWDRIQRGDPPAFRADHDKAGDFARALYGTAVDDTAEPVILDKANAEAWAEYEEAAATIKDAKAVQDTAKAKLLDAIGTAAGGILPDGREVRRSITKESYYTEADAADVTAKVGNVKRAASVSLRARKAK